MTLQEREACLRKEAVSSDLLWARMLTCPLPRNLARNDATKGEKREMVMREEPVRTLPGLSELPLWASQRPVPHCACSTSSPCEGSEQASG